MMKIGIVTATRAEYGLLVPLIRKMMADPFFQVEVIVTGSHLIQRFGNTLQMIVADGIPAAHTVPILEEEEEDTEVQTCHIIARGIQRFTMLFAQNKFDGIVVLGDRYELWSVCIPAYVLKVPIIHINGGDCTEGAIDEGVRHSITKLATLHFPTIEPYRQRIIQMGEAPETVFAVGSLSLDAMQSVSLLTREKLLAELRIEDRPFTIVTYHPTTVGETTSPEEQIIELLESLLAFPQLLHIITYPNADPGGQRIFEKIMQYAIAYPELFKVCANLGQQKYYSVLQQAVCMVGNSSSGIMEAASFKLPVVNVGNRQKGRIAPKNVCHCQCNRKEIINCMKLCISTKFYDKIVDIENFYGDGKTSDKILNVLKNNDVVLCKK